MSTTSAGLPAALKVHALGSWAERARLYHWDLARRRRTVRAKTGSPINLSTILEFPFEYEVLHVNDS